MPKCCRNGCNSQIPKYGLARQMLLCNKHFKQKAKNQKNKYANTNSLYCLTCGKSLGQTRNKKYCNKICFKNKSNENISLIIKTYEWKILTRLIREQPQGFSLIKSLDDLLFLFGQIYSMGRNVNSLKSIYLNFKLVFINDCHSGNNDTFPLSIPSQLCNTNKFMMKGFIDGECVSNKLRRNGLLTFLRKNFSLNDIKIFFEKIIKINVVHKDKLKEQSSKKLTVEWLKSNYAFKYLKNQMHIINKINPPLRKDILYFEGMHFPFSREKDKPTITSLLATCIFHELSCIKKTGFIDQFQEKISIARDLTKPEVVELSQDSNNLSSNQTDEPYPGEILEQINLDIIKYIKNNVSAKFINLDSFKTQVISDNH